MNARPLSVAAMLLTAASLLGVTMASGQEVPPGEARGIWIADASGSLRPAQVASRSFLSQDRAGGQMHVVLWVESFAGSATGALAAAELAVTRVRGALSASGIGGANVTSELAYLEPRHRYRILAGNWEEPQRLGFDAGVAVSVRGVSPASVGRAVDAAIGAGASRALSLGPDSGPR